MGTSALPRLIVVRREVCFPIRINDGVVYMFVHFYHFGLPLIQIHRLDLGDVDLQLSMLSRASETDECSEGD
jgi:hypothetical protein